MTITEAQTAPKQKQNRILSILLGILFLIPAALACGLSQLFLSIGTFVTSLQKSNLISPSQFIGMANYSHLFQDEGFLAALKFTGLTVLELLLVVAFVSALLAWGATLLGRGLRLTLRVLFTIPVVIIVPVAIALVWSHLLDPASGFLSQPLITGPSQARQVVLFLDALYAIGLACGVGLIFFLGILRKPQSGTSLWKPFLTVWSIGLISVIAAGLQSFTLSYGLTRGGPANSTMNFLLYLYNQGFVRMNFGMGAAVGIFLLVVLAVLGLAAGAVIVFSNLKIELVSRSGRKAGPEEINVRNKPGRSLGIIALILVLLIGIGSLIVGLLPFPILFAAALKGVTSGLLQQLPAIGPMLINTILPPLIAVLFIQTPISYLAALGIGGLRPLGKWSEWLLLLFCPWLFVGLGPLSLQIFSILHQVGLLGTFISLIPPLVLSVPMLVILTLFFKGQTAHLAQEQGKEKTTFKLFFIRIILPSIPLTALLVCAGVFISMFDSLWNLITATKASLFPVSNVLWMINGAFSGNSAAMIGALLLLVVFPIMVVFFLIFAAFQLFYLDRLALST